MRITSGKVVIKKDDGNLIGISIGGGAPLCPCIYVVQVRDLMVTYFFRSMPTFYDIYKVRKPRMTKLGQGTRT